MTRSARVVPRRLDAPRVAASRLASEPALCVSLGDAGPATLQLRRAAAVSIGGIGLTVSTRFGRMSWYGYEAWLLALTSVDIGLAEHGAVREAFVHYALAALPSAVGAALGNPRYDDTCANQSCDSSDSCDAGNSRTDKDNSLVVSLGCALPRLSVSMSVRLDAKMLNAMIEAGRWHALPPTIAPWLARLPSRARVIAGTLLLPYAGIQSLTNGDIIRVPSPTFDAAGVGRLVVAGVALQVRWRDADSSFEILAAMHDETSSSMHAPTVALPSSNTSSPIDPARLPVQLSFVIGTLDLTLGALAAAGIGTLLRLAEGMPPTVRIEANGVPVGYGELVDLDGRLAVEITQWHGGSGDSASP